MQTRLSKVFHSPKAAMLNIGQELDSTKIIPKVQHNHLKILVLTQIFGILDETVLRAFTKLIMINT